MSAIATFTVVDYASANHNFIPQRIDALGVAHFLGDQSVYSAKERVSVGVALPKGNNKRAVVTSILAIPMMDAVDTTKKVDEMLCVVKHYIPPTATLTQKQNFRRLAANLVNTSSVVVDAVDLLNSPY